VVGKRKYLCPTCGRPPARKRKKSRGLSFSVSAEFYERLKAYADARGVSMRSVVAGVVEGVCGGV
jgi:hypothetical protein